SFFGVLFLVAAELVSVSERALFFSSKSTCSSVGSLEGVFFFIFFVLDFSALFGLAFADLVSLFDSSAALVGLLSLLSLPELPGEAFSLPAEAPLSDLLLAPSLPPPLVCPPPSVVTPSSSNLNSPSGL